MFAKVRLITGFQEPLWYKIPASQSKQCVVGSVVRVPLQRRTVSGVVEYITLDHPAVSFAIKPAKALEPFPPDSLYAPFIKQLAHYYQIDYMVLVKRLQQFLKQSEVKARVHHQVDQAGDEHKEILLTEQQQAVCDFVSSGITNGQYTPTLLHGVTGSGKTEVYKRLIEHAVALQKTTLLLLPEVTLAVQFARLLRRQLPEHIKLYSFHSSSGIAEKRALWHSLIAQEPIVIIGVHLPVLLPMANLGLMIIDEEHEVGYQEKKHPKINSKEAAIWRAQHYKVPVLLGSATPSVASLANIKTKNWHFFQLEKRFKGIFPSVKIESLQDKKNRRNFWISTALEKAMQARIKAGEQTILFLNRRGFSFFVQCKECSFIFMCDNCSVSLTLHSDGRLSCHYCTSRLQLPSCCPSCKAGEKAFLKKGVGTQQVVAIIEKLLPSARVARADLDTTINKKHWQETLDRFEKGLIDILVGTQTITKGYHFPNVTLVGILWADLNLHFPIYNAAETCLQQLVQVAGRAGRTGKPSQVIVQTMVEHSIFDYLNEVDYIQFYQKELAKRSVLNYPPILRLVEIEFKHSDEAVIEHEAAIIAKQLRTNAGNGLIVLGPAKPPVHKVKRMYSRKIYIKSGSIKDIIALYRQINVDSLQSSIYFTPNPLT